MNPFLEEVKALLKLHPEWTKTQAEREAIRLHNEKLKAKASRAAEAQQKGP